MSLKDQKGFTLLELIVVCAVIGVLAVIAVPQYIQYMNRGERAAVVSSARSMYRAFMLYYVDDPDGTGGYPYVSTAPAFNKATLFPLTGRGDGLNYLDFDPQLLTKKLVNDQVDAFDSPDDPLTNGEFYVVMTLKGTSNTQIVVSQSDEIKDGSGNPIPVIGANWHDGVYVLMDGKFIH